MTGIRDNISLAIRNEDNRVNRNNAIMTIGLNPCWDITCTVEGLEWGDHKTITGQTCRAAGKPLNVSRALAWMGVPNIATGLWGSDDYDALLSELKSFSRNVDPRFVRVDGSTRKNISILDPVNHRETHLRSNAELASPQALSELQNVMEEIVLANHCCLVAGTLGSEEHLGNIVRVIELCLSKGARVALDTSGEPLRALVNNGDLWLIKPNVMELGELLQEDVADRTDALIEAGRTLLDRVDNILISRGANGAIYLTNDQAICAHWKPRDKKIINTVASGDFLLAGFLNGTNVNADPHQMMTTAIQAATCRCLGWDHQRSWSDCRSEINVHIESQS